jgi:EmrB/QacA subfamily drug resistance transporter
VFLYLTFYVIHVYININNINNEDIKMKAKNILALVATCIGIFICMLDTTVMNIALPAIQTNLHTSLNNLQWSINAYMIVFASLTIPLGKLAERFGLSRFYLFGLVLFLAGSLISAFSGNLSTLLIGRIIQAMGAATIFPLSMILGISTTSVEKRTGVIAALGMTQGLAAAVGPTIGGVLTQFLSWRWIFLVNLPLILLMTILCVLSFDFRQPIKRVKVDFVGALLSIIALFALTLALVQGREWSWHSPVIIGLFILSIVALIIFIMVERKLAEPMIPLQLFRSRQFNGASLVLILSNLFLIGVTVVLPTYFTKIQGKEELMAAILVTPITAMIFVMSPIAAILINKLGARLMIATGFLAMAGGYLLFATISMTNYIQVLSTCALLGAGYGIIAGPIVVLAASDFTGEMLTASQSVAGVLREVGMVLGVAIFVTGLYSNVNLAKSQSISDAKAQIQKLNIPTKAKNTMTQEVVSQIKAEKTQGNNRKNFISKSERHQIIQENFTKALVSHPELPDDAQQKILQLVTIKVDYKIRNTNQQINQASIKIRENTKNKFTKAFTSLYVLALPFVILSGLTAILFNKKTVK